MNRTFRHLWPACMIGLAVPATQFFAAAGHAAALEEMVVTARKREENLQETPLSIQALGKSELENRSITSVTDLQSSVPNLSMPGAGAAGSSTNSSVYIRGVGQSDTSITMDPGVGVYIDGVYRARLQGGALELMDIERIEVLRGPQGTLYGRNTIGGAINIVSSRPGNEVGARMKLGVGNYDLRSASIVGNLPLIEDKLLARLSLGYSDRDGYSKNTFTGERWNDKNFIGSRVVLDYLATDTLSFNFNADWSKRNLHNAGSQCVVLNPNAQVFRLLDASLGFGEACRATQRGKKLEFAHDLKSLDKNTEWGFGLTADWELSADIALKSITAFRRLEWEGNSDVDGTALALVTSRQAPSTQDQWSQELQLQGETLDGDLNWTSGLYFFTEKANRPGFAETFPFNSFTSRNRKTDNDSYAAFGQATYQFNPAWSLTAGLRYTYEERAFSSEEYNLVSGVPLSLLDGKEDFDALTPMLNLSYAANENVLVYASWSQGYKSGGFNARANPDTPLSPAPFDPEQVDAWELGIKSTWLDNRLTVNLAAFQTNYDDIQLTVFTATSTGSFLSLVENAGKAEIRGVELDINAQLTSWWKISGGYGRTDAKYKKFDTIDTATRQTVDQTHLSFANTPLEVFNLSSEWRLPVVVADIIEETKLRVDYSHNSGYYNDVINTPQLKTSAFSLLNASLVMTFNDSRSQLQLWGKNLTNEFYVTGALSLADSFGVGQRYLSEPRTYGVSLSHEF